MADREVRPVVYRDVAWITGLEVRDGIEVADLLELVTHQGLAAGIATDRQVGHEQTQREMGLIVRVVRLEQLEYRHRAVAEQLAQQQFKLLDSLLRIVLPYV